METNKKVMFHKPPAGRNAFSLVELVIVVAILGIVAAIALPRAMQSAVTGGNESSLIHNLAALRRAIEIYASEHDGDNPGVRPDGSGGGANSVQTFINQLTMYSDHRGKVSATGDTLHPYGPYLHKIPMAPVGKNQGRQDVAIDTSNATPLVTTGDEGWVYNPVTGRIIVNTDDPNSVGSRTYDEY